MHLAQCLVDFFVSHISQPEHHSQLQQLRDQVRMQVPMPTSQHAWGYTILHPSRLKAIPVCFVCRDTQRTPLQCPYEGPFKVMQAGDKTFTIDRGGRKEVISVDRLKPVLVDLEHPVAVSKPKNCGSTLNKDRLVIPTQSRERTKIVDPACATPSHQIRPSS